MEGGNPKSVASDFCSSLVLDGAEISGDSSTAFVTGEARSRTPSIVLPHQQPDYVNHIAIDIGGSLIKLVFFSLDDVPMSLDSTSVSNSAGNGHGHAKGGRLHFVKFETNRMSDALAFIKDKGLHFRDQSPGGKMRVVATGGGAHRFADVFRDELGLVLEKEDEMECLVSGCNFLLNAIRDEAFTYHNGATSYLRLTDDSNLYPYLLVNIGSGVSIVKVNGEDHYERVSGTNLGGGTFWGLCRLLTRVKNFDEMLELSVQGSNKNVDMLVGDIYGGRDYTQIGLSADTIASSFGKVASQDMDLEDYNPADIALALCRMVSYNIGHLAYLNAMRYNLKRVIFGGYFIRGYSYTMNTISYAIKFWSKGSMDALFLRHEGFLGAMGAFLKVHPITPPPTLVSSRRSGKLEDHVREVYPIGAPFSGGYIKGPAFSGISSKVTWVEKFVQLGQVTVEAQKKQSKELSGEINNQQNSNPLPMSPKIDLHVGVLHFKPSNQTFPLLADPENYEPNTIDITSNAEERDFWVKILEKQIPTVVEKAIASEGGNESAHRRGQALAAALRANFDKVNTEAYGVKGLADLLEMRELCLREFEFTDVYRLEKEGENSAALQVLPDLLKELDSMKPRQRLLALVEGALAANIFDWGSQECIAKYKEGTILSIYKDARKQLSKRPWRIDTFDVFEDTIFGSKEDVESPPFRRVAMFVDNAGADIVLGMIPLAREFLRMGCEVVMVANSLPAINDITASELVDLIGKASECCSTLEQAHVEGTKIMRAGGGIVPAFNDKDQDVVPKLFVISSGSGSPCLDLRCTSGKLARAAAGTDLVVIEGMGRAIHTNFYARFTCSSLKLAMIKTERVAVKLFNGNLYDSVCVFEPGVSCSK